MTSSEDYNGQQSMGPWEKGALSADDAEQLTQHLAQASLASPLLADGLRAAAEETQGSRVADALRWIAGRLDAGQTLEKTLNSAGNMLPPTVSGFLNAATHTETLGDALLELTSHQREARSLRRTVVASFAYPVLVFCLTLTLLSLLLIFIAGGFKEMYEDFGMSLPGATSMLFWCREVGLWWLAGIVISVVIALALLRAQFGSAGWRSFCLRSRWSDHFGNGAALPSGAV